MSLKLRHYRKKLSDASKKWDPVMWAGLAGMSALLVPTGGIIGLVASVVLGATMLLALKNTL